MNKYIKTLYTGILALAVGFSSCNSDFLNEKPTSLTTKYYETQQGLDALATGMYQSLKFHFNYVWAITTTQMGTDEMSIGNDGTEAAWNDYSSSLSPADGYAIGAIWDNMYGGIASANTLIQNMPLYYDNTSASYNIRLGEGHFIRAFNYFKLVRQFGGVPVKTIPSDAPEFEFTRNTEEEVFAQIIADFEEAYRLLPERPAAAGRITKYAAAHFLAKVHLVRASELYSSWNSSYISSDLDKVIQYGEEVITAHPLCNNYIDLWNYTGPNSANESVSEVILAAQFSDNTSTQGRYGNQIHLYYPSIYQNLAGCRRDISGDREFSRLRTTNYSLDVFDRKNDSRFWKSFITTYNCNSEKEAPEWGDYAPAGIAKTDKRFAGGEIGIKYIVNDANDSRYTASNIGYEAPHTFVRYFAGETPTYIEERGNMGSVAVANRYVALSKFRDGSRIDIASQFGRRDGILARSGETYLMVAEALGRQKKYTDALPYINALRDRAAYKDGEDREKHVDGGQAFKTNPSINSVAGAGGYVVDKKLVPYAIYSEENTYYESNNIASEPKLTSNTLNDLKITNVNDIFNSAKEFYDVLDCKTDEEKFLCFILNERTRELCGELYRWEDLARTKTLAKRYKTFNDRSALASSAFNENTHYLRPLPQAFLDNITKDGKALTAEEKQAMQNPGY